jgi:hypothetical protein
VTYVDDAFLKCKSTLEITATEAKEASRPHGDIRDLVRGSWELDDDFLTGSYRRDTKRADRQPQRSDRGAAGPYRAGRRRAGRHDDRRRRAHRRGHGR